MSGKMKIGLTVVVCGLLAGTLLVIRARSHPPVAVTIRISVTPVEQADFVTDQANSARFKYMIGTRSGLKPVLAQKLSVKALPNSGVIEARLGLETKEEAQRYVEAFVETLQRQCGGKAQLALVDQKIR
jgi:hypothetical protein